MLFGDYNVRRGCVAKDGCGGGCLAGTEMNFAVDGDETVCVHGDGGYRCDGDARKSVRSVSETASDDSGGVRWWWGVHLPGVAGEMAADYLAKSVRSGVGVGGGAELALS